MHFKKILNEEDELKYDQIWAPVNIILYSTLYDSLGGFIEVWMSAGIAQLGER